MYQVNLYYGYEEHESGIYHAFRAEALDAEVDTDEITADLAEQLDRDPDDDCFNWGSMYVDLPAAVVAKIKADAVAEYLASTQKKT